MAIDLQQVSAVDVEPGELPKTMAAWVIREERFGEPKDAFQVEEIDVPEPGAFEVIVRVMAAGVNYNNVWAALGKPVSVMRYGDHPEFGHHIGGSDASGIVWKVGAGVTRWKPGDEVVVHCNQASYEDPEVHGLDPMAAPSQMIWGYETTWGSFAQFTKVQAQQLLPKPAALTWEEAASYGLVYFTAYRMLITRCKLQAGQRVLIWGAAGGLGVFATQLCAAAGAHCVGVVSSPAKGELVKRLGAVDFIDRAEFAGMMRTGEESAEEEKARFGVSREFSKRVKEILGDAPDVVFEHVGQATFPTSVFTVKPFGKVVICAGTTGFNLDFDVALPVDEAEGDPRLALRQRLRVHKGQRADREWADKAGAVAHAGLRGSRRSAPADARKQASGKDLDPGRRRVGGPGQDRRGPGRDPRRGRRLMAGTVIVPWYATGFRPDDFEQALNQVAATALRYGASSYDVYRARATTATSFQQLAVFDEHIDWERYWDGPEMTYFRATPFQLVSGAGALRLVGSHRKRRRTGGGARAKRSCQRARQRRPRRAGRRGRRGLSPVRAAPSSARRP